MKFKILTLAVVTALIGVGAVAAPFPPFGDPVGYINEWSLFPSVPAQKDAYLDGFPNPFKQVGSISSDNITFEIFPNVYEYTNAVASGVASNIFRWTDNALITDPPGLDGGRWLEHNIYYTVSTPNGTTGVTFNVTVNSDDLDSRYKQTTYEPRIFIKVLDSVGASWATLEQQYTELAGPGSYNVSLGIDGVTYNGQEMQVGFLLEGQNANVATDWGSIGVTVNSLTLSSGDFTAPTPAPTFFSGPVALSDSSITMTSTTASDPAGVEYQFTNSTLGYASAWQAGTTWIDQGPIGPATTGDVDVVVSPDFSQLEPVWEGWVEPGGDVVSTTFVTVNSGVATVTPADAGEKSFYQSRGAGGPAALAPNQDYEFSFSSANVTVNGTAAGAFVKAFSGGWAEDLGQQQKVPFTGGAQTISFTTDGGASVYYQIGFYTEGATTGSYDVTDIELLGLNLVQAGTPTGLTPLTEYDYQVRARDLSTELNTTDWSAISSATTLAGDITPPSPDPMTFAGPGDPSPQSVKMTATTAIDDSAVEYYFEAVSGDGADSGWQSSPIYVDTGLASSSNFQYRVRARDLSLQGNTNGWSLVPISITTLPYPLSVSLADSLKGFTPGTSNEDLTVHDVLKGDLQFSDYADLNRRVAFNASGATFGSFIAGDNGRNVLKTLANDYASADFEAYITSSFDDGDQNIFIGFGPGDLGAFGVPDWSPNGETTNASFIVQVFTNGVEVWSQTNNFGGGNFATTASDTTPLVVGTDQRIKLDYAAGPGTCTVSVDTDYDGVTFSPNVVLGPISTPEFNNMTTIYLGGDDGVILSDFEIVGGAAPLIPVSDLVITSTDGTITTLSWTSVSGQSYDVVYKTALTAGSWTPDGANQNISGTGGVLNKFSATGAADNKFFQVITDYE